VDEGIDMIVGCSYDIPEQGSRYFNVVVDELKVEHIADGVDELLDYLQAEQVNFVDRIEYLMDDSGDIVWEHS